MNKWKVLLISVAVLVLILVAGYLLLPQMGVGIAALFRTGSIQDVQVAEGFRLSVFVEELAGPRFIAFGPEGRLFVAERDADRIVVLPDEDGDGKADAVIPFAEGLDSPHSLVYREGSWYIGVPAGVTRLTDADGDLRAEEIVPIFENRTPGAHNTRTVLFLPDGRMVVALGSSCNVCEESDPYRAAVTVYDGPDASFPQIYASGLRNAVGLALHPETGQLWATNNGRDFMGDDLPPETVYALEEGGFYGWPYCHSGDLIDPDFGFPGACEGVGQPVVEMQAHSAPLGMVFYTGDSFPEAYRGDLFVAFHGSWNRSVPTGYKVVRIPLEGSSVAGPVEDFVWGWLSGGAVSGRPVGLAVGPDGALYISDDHGGRIYRVQAGP